MNKIDKIKVHISNITEDIVNICYNLGYCVWYCLGLDELSEAINDDRYE